MQTTTENTEIYLFSLQEDHKETVPIHRNINIYIHTNRDTKYITLLVERNATSIERFQLERTSRLSDTSKTIPEHIIPELGTR